jgi:DNA-binding NarL/FixJ family response regulator
MDELIRIVRVLLVDDSAAFRSWTKSMLTALEHLQIIGEAEDGFEAVFQADELKPDLILLDIGLPNLNGIEAAKLIQENEPQAKVLFVSQNDDLDVIRAHSGNRARRICP